VGQELIELRVVSVYNHDPREGVARFAELGLFSICPASPLASASNRAKSMISQLRDRILIAATAVLLVGGMTGLVLWRARGQPPTLEEVRAKARVGQFERAQALLERYLHTYPDNPQAHMLMAELATEPTNVDPKLALDHLHVIQPGNPKQAALVQFLKGKAHFQEGRYDLTENCWIEALRLDPIVPEAGWALVDLLDKEGRTEEAHALGIRLHEMEPDPRDRVKILLEMSRIDIETPDPLSQVELFQSLVREHPEHLPLCLSLGLSLIRVNRSSEGIELLKRSLERHPVSPEAWDTWLTGLYLASEPDKLVVEFARLPRELASNPRFAKHEGMVAQFAQDWPRAAAAYSRAFQCEPFDWGVCSRLRFVLRQAGNTAELARIDRIYENYKAAYKEMRGSYYERFKPGETPDFRGEDFTQQRGAYYETLSIKTLGVKPHPEVYQRLAELREKMGRFDEARAWHRVVLRDSPDDPVSMAALERLK
jgi:tetratricopeptide (TPR) repeat protein